MQLYFPVLSGLLGRQSVCVPGDKTRDRVKISTEESTDPLFSTSLTLSMTLLPHTLKSR